MYIQHFVLLMLSTQAMSDPLVRYSENDVILVIIASTLCNLEDVNGNGCTHLEEEQVIMYVCT